MTTAKENKEIVLKAFDTLFNKRDYQKAAEFWSETYIQHSAHIAPGRAGLFDLVSALPETLHYENAVVLAEGDYVMLHGRNQKAADRCLALHSPSQHIELQVPQPSL